MKYLCTVDKGDHKILLMKIVTQPRQSSNSKRRYLPDRLEELRGCGQGANCEVRTTFEMKQWEKKAAERAAKKC